MPDDDDSMFSRPSSGEKLPATLSVHLTDEQKRRFELFCSFEGQTPSGALREFVMSEIRKWEERFQSMQQTFGEKGSSSSESSPVGDSRG